MKKRIVAFVTITFLIFASLQVNRNTMPSVLSSGSVTGREIWKIVNVTNPMPYNTIVDINVSVTSRQGVHIACSANITAFFENSTGYATWWDWLNGNETVPYHWGEMDWIVSNGSLTSISYDKIQHWGDMYLDSGGGVEYKTFMGNTYMADWNLSDSANDPDIVSTAYWEGNRIRIINDLIIPANSTVNMVFKIVLTESGAYNFNLTTTPGVTISPSSWTVGGAATILVPYDYPTIYEAINNASAGETILVYPGTYSSSKGEVFPETINIANLTIKSKEGASLTIIDGENRSWGPAFHIRANGVKIEGFTIKNFKADSSHDIGGILVEGNNSIISDNVLENIFNSTTEPAGIGIDIHARNVKIIGNIVHDVGSIGIRVRDHWKEEFQGPSTISNSIVIENNTVYRTNNTCVLVTGYARGVIIENNEIYESLKPTPYNIFIHYNASNIVIKNNYIYDAYGNIVLAGCNNVTIKGNVIANTTSHPIDPTVKGKNIYILNDYGNWTGNPELLSTNIRITNSTIRNGGYGIRILYTATTGNAEPMVLTTTINYNNIFGNDHGLENNVNVTVDARYNWWGNETGPKHLTLNPDGLGDDVSDNVIFEPWLIKSYPPLMPISVVYVTPKSISLEVPSLGTQFTVYVTIANVSGLYGFQFTIKWNSSLLTLTNPTTAHRIPLVWGNNYISQFNYSLTDGNYTLFASARSPAPTFNGTTDVAMFIFKSVYDPIYPQNVTCGLSLENVDLVDEEAKAILHLVYSGNYSCYSKMPELVLNPQEPSAYKVPAEFDVNVSIIIVVNLNAFEFELQYNKSLLEVLAVDVPFPAPIVGYGDGKVYVNVTGITPPVNGSRVLATIRFKAARGIVWNTQTHVINSSLNFTIHRLNGGLIEHKAVNGTYRYTPVPGDLDMDGAVTIIDLSAAARAFGTSIGDPDYQGYADLNLDGRINIRDIVLIARNFGREGP